MERGTILTTAAAGLTFVLTYYLHAWLQHPFKKTKKTTTRQACLSSELINIDPVLAQACASPQVEQNYSKEL